LSKPVTEVSVTRLSSVLYYIKPSETLITGLIKYNTDESLVTETLVTGLIKYNTDESLVTETLVTG
jgi:hypothetical protein